MPTRIMPSDIAPFADGTQIVRAQTFDYTSQLGSDRILELANAGVVEYLADIPRIGYTLNLNEYDGSFATDLVMFNQPSNDTSIVAPTDFAYGVPMVDFRVSVQRNAAIYSTDWISRAMIERWSMNFDVGGYIRTTYSGTGDMLKTFLGANSDARVAIGTYASGSTFTIPTIGTFADFTPLYVRVNEVLVPTADITITSATLITVANITLNTLDRIRFIYKKTTAGTYPALTSSGIGALRRGCAKIWYKPHSGSFTRWYRLQNATIDLNMAGDEENEIGTKYPIMRGLTTPLECTINCTATRDDLLSYGAFADKDSTSVTELNLEDIMAANRGAQFKVVIYDHDSGTQTLKKVVLAENLAVTSMDYRGTVGNAPTQISFALAADKVTIKNSDA